MVEFDAFVLVVATVVVMVVLAMASRRRKSPWNAQMQCGACGAVHPAMAQFCPRCGRRLKG